MQVFNLVNGYEHVYLILHLNILKTKITVKIIVNIKKIRICFSNHERRSKDERLHNIYNYTQKVPRGLYPNTRKLKFNVYHQFLNQKLIVFNHPTSNILLK